jgi:outer membrane protein TolC
MRMRRAIVPAVFLMCGFFLEVRAQSGYPAGSPAVRAPAQRDLSGSVPAGQPTSQVLPLSLKEAIARGLKQNLGVLLAGYGVGGARGEKWRELSNLLPTVSARVSENVAQVNLASLGFRKPLTGIPEIVGPFGFFDMRGYVTQTFVDWSLINRTRSAGASVRATRYSYQDARDLVVLTVGNAYLEAVAGAARVDAAVAQQTTAQALYDLARDQLKAGLAPSIDALRAQVELQTRQQQVIVARNEFAKQKLRLARAIGLPLGQEFTLSDKALYEPMERWTLEQALERAYATRADYQSAKSSVRAAEFFRKAAAAEYLPSLGFNGDYGVVGVTPGNSHGVFDASIVLRVPVFQGNRVHGDVLVSQAVLDQSRAQLEDLRGQIDYDVRSAFLDLQAASQRVAVARSNVNLANQTLEQSQDRFKAGVTNNVEVVQAQDAVASANESYISSLYAYDLAKISLARAVGNAEVGVQEYLKGN